MIKTQGLIHINLHSNKFSNTEQSQHKPPSYWSMSRDIWNQEKIDRIWAFINLTSVTRFISTGSLDWGGKNNNSITLKNTKTNKLIAGMYLMGYQQNYLQQYCQVFLQNWNLEANNEVESYAVSSLPFNSLFV